MLYAVGFKKEDFSKPHIGVASTWSQVTPCNVHIDKLAIECSNGINAAIYRDLPYDLLTAFDPVSLLVVGPITLFVNPRFLQVSTVAELIALVRARPGALRPLQPLPHRGNGR